MIFYLVTNEHAYTMAGFLGSWGRALASRITIVPYDALFAGRRIPKDASVIFSDLDRLTGRGRALLGQIHGKLAAEVGTAHVLNDPQRSLLRCDLLQTLHARGINRFAAWRADRDAMPARLPAFVRDARGFAATPPPLLETPEQYRAAIDDLETRRVPPEHRLAIEFCDTADNEGIYRKYGVFVVGDTIVPRHLFFSRNWFIKAADLADPALLAEERAFVKGNPHVEALREVFRLAGISYGRVDYSVLDGRLCVWEINTNPAVTPGGEDIPERRLVHERFVSMLVAAFIAVDSRSG